MRRLHDLWRRGRRAARAAVPDAELLDRFVRHADHAAFAELVDRLGPLVYGACRRLLPNPADVEDAFQATFLVLVRRADAVAGRAVGPWLHRVAVWTARRYRQQNARAATPPPAALPRPGSPPTLEAADARLDIDAAVSALPEKYRVAVTLCHLQGWTRGELAAHLGCPESTASSLVGRGLARLRKRLAGRDPAVALAVAGAAAVPPGLAAAAVRAAGLYRTSSLAAAASPAVAELTEGALRMFRVKTWTTAGAGLALVAGVGLAVGLTAGFGPRADAQPPLPPADLKAEREKVDRDLAKTRALLKALEAEKAALDERAKREEKAPVGPHIAIWVRPQGVATNVLTSGSQLRGLTFGTTYGLTPPPLGLSTNTLTTQPGPWNYNPTGMPLQSDFAINEFGGPDQPVVEAHFNDVRSLQTYLTRAAKDPAAPKKVRLHVYEAYSWEKAKAVIDACKAAGLGPIEMATAPGSPPPPTAATVLKEMAGTWEVVSLEFDGKAPGRDADATAVIVEKDQLAIKGATRVEPYTVKLDTTATPWRIDMTFDRPGARPALGIVKLEAGTLTILVGEVGGTRPDTFDGKSGTKFVLRRAKGR
jgi:RNA polymerase sigma factor (sigma-70 family)